MLYIYSKFNKSAYWANPFIMISGCLVHIFKEKGIQCKITDDASQITSNDIVFLFSGPDHGYLGAPELHNKKIIYINSESIQSRPHVIEDCNNDNIVQVWDYSLKNITALRPILKNPNKIQFVPIVYHKYFEIAYNIHKNKKNVNKDIDFCLFGGVGKRRRVILDELQQAGHNVWFGGTSNISELVKIIQRSKIVIIIHYYEFDLCIDFYRLHLLLSNKIFTIHETPSKDQQHPSFNKIIYSDYDKFVSTCKKYIKVSQSKRDEISNEIYNWWKTEHPMQKYISITKT